MTPTNVPIIAGYGIRSIIIPNVHSVPRIESNVIYPHVVGNSVGLPGIYVMMTVVIFGSLAGIPGMFLGIPTMASVYKIGVLYLSRKERLKEMNG